MLPWTLIGRWWCREGLGKQQATSGASRLDGSTRLHGFLSARVAEMRAAIQQLAIKGFNEWLVGVKWESKPQQFNFPESS